MKKSGYVEYGSNNSGGSWWLTDKDWFALEKAGWDVEWGELWFCHGSNFGKDRPSYLKRLCPEGKDCRGHKSFASGKDMKDGDRWLGALAKGAKRYGLTLHQAVEEWERVTGKSSTDAGCPCCGQPHYFTEYDSEGKQVDSGPSTSYSASW